MAVKYFPERVQKKHRPAIDALVRHITPHTFRLAKDISSEGVSQVISYDRDWQIDSISIKFSNSDVRDYSMTVVSGLYVREHYNDYLWFHHENSIWQRIELNEGFYKGDELATELETQLNNNDAFSELGINFTVTYSWTSGEFTITPSSGTLRYIQTNNTQTLPYRDSTAGHLFGLTEDSSYGATVVSDTAVYLGSEASIIDESGSGATEHYHDDIHYLTMDQSLKIETSTANQIVDIEVVYREQ